MGSFLDGLERTFSRVDNKIVDLYVTMPEEEVTNLRNITQVSTAQVQNSGSRYLDDFEYEKAVIVAKYDGEEKTFEKVKFKTGGMYARSNEKVGFNIKLDSKLLGRKNIRLRPDDGDKSHLRSKLACDIANRMGVPSIQATYARLYMNDEFWGLYVLLDSLKTSWIKNTFNPSGDEVTTFFQCKDKGMDFEIDSYKYCYNANDDYDTTILERFVEEVNNCETAAELEEIMDVEVFLKYMAFEWLIGSFDHFLVNGHNFYLYKRETDGKWLIVEHDYDNTFGAGVNVGTWMGKGKIIANPKTKTEEKETDIVDEETELVDEETYYPDEETNYAEEETDIEDKEIDIKEKETDEIDNEEETEYIYNEYENEVLVTDYERETEYYETLNEDIINNNEKETEYMNDPNVVLVSDGMGSEYFETLADVEIETDWKYEFEKCPGRRTFTNSKGQMELDFIKKRKTIIITKMIQLKQLNYHIKMST